METTLEHPPIYWLEADEEASLFVSGKQSHFGRRSLLAYLLLRRRIVVHPADLWQSKHSNHLLFDEQAQPLLKKAVNLHLGDSTSATDYIADRVEKLRRDKASSQVSTVELNQYLQYGDLLAEQSSLLDDNFTKRGATFRIEGSRDSRFRQLITLDLEDTIPFGPHLAAIMRQGLDRNHFDRVLKTLRNLAHDKQRFISIDGIISRMKNIGCKASTLTLIHSRLQLLHWEARSQGLIEMPLLTRAKDAKLDASDPDVFWYAMDGLLGKDFQVALMSSRWSVAVGIVTELRADGAWADFIETYHAIVETVEQDHKEINEQIVRAEAQKRYPSLARTAFNNSPDRLTLLSWVCSLGSWYVGSMTPLALTFRIGSAFTTVTRGYDWAVRFGKALFCNERQLLKSRIRNLIADATKVR